MGEADSVSLAIEPAIVDGTPADQPTGEAAGSVESIVESVMAGSSGDISPIFGPVLLVPMKELPELSYAQVCLYDRTVGASAQLVRVVSVLQVSLRRLTCGKSLQAIFQVGYGGQTTIDFPAKVGHGLDDGLHLVVLPTMLHLCRQTA